MPALESNSNPPAPAVIEMVDVTVQSLATPRRVLLENVDWMVQIGDFWAVGGLQGSGKTDFLMLLAGMMSPAHGSYHLFGEELGSGYEQDTLSSRLQVGLVFDGGQLLHHLTLWENISLPLQYHRNCHAEECRETVDALMDLLRLGDCASHYPGETNRNDRQRAALARALILKPKLLLLDCPLSGLDPRQVKWWQKTLKSLSQGHPLLDNKSLTVVVTDSNLVSWKHCASQFAILKNGRFLTMEKELAPAEHAEKLLHELLLTDLESE